MKKFFFLSLLTAILFNFQAGAQADKSKRPSPPAADSATTTSGLKIKVEYSQPSVKGRTMGKDIAPYGKVWRTGANEATTFEISKDAMVQGKKLPAGKYGLYTIPGEKEWTIIFNKTWKQWGTNYTEGDDALRVTAVPAKADKAYEQMMIDVDQSGAVTLSWADTQVKFDVK
ncbi:DUF2911 domain-containing protein [Segetibacter sp. 3557_3]|uniref:DUF2911 domain-containing protein n=1 Tax=Segetibacter sp. 3557_3 TaxID=2547429 RepID=UPI001058F6C1|nr:DUF2911 domain-containing protein [Segetibacter sp. 3557_3]TDH25485.1 DUF2911 domain-containing protein [Segetibacter sp. 3557_3]